MRFAAVHVACGRGNKKTTDQGMKIAPRSEQKAGDSDLGLYKIPHYG